MTPEDMMREAGFDVWVSCEELTLINTGIDRHSDYLTSLRLIEIAQREALKDQNKVGGPFNGYVNTLLLNLSWDESARRFL